MFISWFNFQHGYDAMQAQAMVGAYQGEWQDYQYAEQMAYPDQYLQQDINYDMQAELDAQQDPRLMTQEQKDRGLGSVFKRDDQRLQQLREKDAREKDPNFISESYSECYPGYQEYNREVANSEDEEEDLSKMDMGGRVSFFISICYRLDFLVSHCRHNLCKMFVQIDLNNLEKKFIIQYL